MLLTQPPVLSRLCFTASWARPPPHLRLSFRKNWTNIPNVFRVDGVLYLKPPCYMNGGQRAAVTCAA